MYNAINELSGDAAELKLQIRQYLDFSIRMSRRGQSPYRSAGTGGEQELN